MKSKNTEKKTFGEILNNPKHPLTIRAKEMARGVNESIPLNLTLLKSIMAGENNGSGIKIRKQTPVIIDNWRGDIKHRYDKVEKIIFDYNDSLEWLRKENPEYSEAFHLHKWLTEMKDVLDRAEYSVMAKDEYFYNNIFQMIIFLENRTKIIANKSDVILTLKEIFVEPKMLAKVDKLLFDNRYLSSDGTFEIPDDGGLSRKPKQLTVVNALKEKLKSLELLKNLNNFDYKKIGQAFCDHYHISSNKEYKSFDSKGGYVNTGPHIFRFQFLDGINN
ncbi:MAG: hypothetical protein EHM20_00695 [Alphaproteobacteria bacterium]|nr:MAG: hypothetical protein EHM20_00695 [Alphaproteobacteria bacterium]